MTRPQSCCLTCPTSGIFQPATPSRIPISTAKSLFCKFLPVSPTRSSFWRELFFLALCFQYFARKIGGGVGQLPVASCQLPEKPQNQRPSLMVVIRKQQIPPLGLKSSVGMTKREANDGTSAKSEEREAKSTP